MPTPYWEALFNAMHVETAEEAEQTLEKLIAWCQRENPTIDYEKAKEIQLSNIGWFFGDLTRQSREHAMKMWPQAQHPVFGRDFDRDPDEVLQAGMAIGEAMRKANRGTPQS